MHVSCNMIGCIIPGTYDWSMGLLIGLHCHIVPLVFVPGTTSSCIDCSSSHYRHNISYIEPGIPYITGRRRSSRPEVYRQAIQRWFLDGLGKKKASAINARHQTTRLIRAGMLQSVQAERIRHARSAREKNEAR